MSDAVKWTDDCPSAAAASGFGGGDEDDRGTDEPHAPNGAQRAMTTASLLRKIALMGRTYAAPLTAP